MHSLNRKQKQFFSHILHSIKTKEEPLRSFLSGGAGVGKSTVINAFYHINSGVIQGFLALRRAVTTHVKKYRIFSCVLI